MAMEMHRECNGLCHGSGMGRYRKNTVYVMGTAMGFAAGMSWAYSFEIERP
ncbi:MAG: hypothetical protein JRC68_09975 [Deltaproteobacteria bacterium]|nr:hypothetical protein [Deltaproteobacteria bacterium]